MGTNAHLNLLEELQEETPELVRAIWIIKKLETKQQNCHSLQNNLRSQ